MFALEGEGLRHLLHAFAIICSTYVGNIDNLESLNFFLPSRQTVCAYLTDLRTQIFGKLKSTMTPVFDAVGGAISLDIWTDDHKKNSFLSLIAHFIDTNFVLHNRVIANDLFIYKMVNIYLRRSRKFLFPMILRILTTL